MVEVKFVNFKNELNNFGSNNKLDVVQTTKGEYIIVGNDQTEKILVAIATEALDTIQTFNSFGQGKAHDILDLKNETYLISGESSQRALALIIDSTGDKIFEFDLAGYFQNDVGFLRFSSIFEAFLDKDGNIVFTGTLEQENNGEQIFLLKTSQNGKQIGRLRTYENISLGNSKGYIIKENSNNNYLIGGVKEGFQKLYEVNASNNIRILEKTIDENFFSEQIPVEMNLIDSSEILLNGIYGVNGNQLVLNKRDSSFEKISGFESSSSRSVFGYSVLVNKEGNFVLGTFSPDNNAFEIYETNSEGNIFWSNSYDLPEQPIQITSFQTQDEGYFFLINVELPSENRNVVYLLKTDAVGDIEI